MHYADEFQRWVQSSISVITFPDALEELEKCLFFDEESEEVVDWQTDIDFLLDPDEEPTWTAPRWMTEGDLLFVYHAKSANRRGGRSSSTAVIEEHVVERKRN